MFIGHFGLAFAAKRVAPSVSLGTLFLAAQLADLVWPNLVLLGLEKVEVAPGITAVTPLNFVSYPYSHSLLALAVWGAVFAGMHWLIHRRGGVVPWLLGALVLSHWVLDAATHRPDMPLFIGGGPLVGLGLWNSIPATVLIETALFMAGVALYFAQRARATGPACRALGPGRLPAAHLGSEPDGPAAAQRHRSGLGRAIDLAAGAMGILDRSSSGSGWHMMDFLFALPLWVLALVLNVWLMGFALGGAVGLAAMGAAADAHRHGCLAVLRRGRDAVGDGVVRAGRGADRGHRVAEPLQRVGHGVARGHRDCRTLAGPGRLSAGRA